MKESLALEQATKELLEIIKQFEVANKSQEVSQKLHEAVCNTKTVMDSTFEQSVEIYKLLQPLETIHSSLAQVIKDTKNLNEKSITSVYDLEKTEKSILNGVSQQTAILTSNINSSLMGLREAQNISVAQSKKSNVLSLVLICLIVFLIILQFV